MKNAQPKPTCGPAVAPLSGTTISVIH